MYPIDSMLDAVCRPGALGFVDRGCSTSGHLPWCEPCVRANTAIASKDPAQIDRRGTNAKLPEDIAGVRAIQQKYINGKPMSA
jgi:hypothetical protein